MTGASEDCWPRLDDDELTRQALSADPDAEPGADAVPWGDLSVECGLLPAWYMPSPAPSSGRRQPARLTLIVFLGLALLVVAASGFCITNGFLEVA